MAASSSNASSVSEVTPGTSSCSSPDTSPQSYFSSDDELNSATPAEPIAIIGFSLRFPGEATSVEAFWNVLMDGRRATAELPEDRLRTNTLYSGEPTSPELTSLQHAHFLEGDLGAFDAALFSVSAAEAAAMDPQERGLLETTYHALENAGIPLERISGAHVSVHTELNVTGDKDATVADGIRAILNLIGPSVTLDTSNSSSLVAIESACQAIHRGESTMAIVAGCNLIHVPEHPLETHTDEAARGEGFGVLIVKGLADAIRDGDTIRAIIRSTGSAPEEETEMGLPSEEAQVSLIKETYQKAHLDRRLTRYVEAHDAGTVRGDVLEAQAIGAAFDCERSHDDPLFIGSSKANFGHLEGASGVLGLIKAVLVLERGIIPPVAGHENVSEEVDSDALKIKFPTECAPWPRRGLRRASVSSFGINGTNSHVILDDACHYMRKRRLNGRHCTVVIPPTVDELSDREFLRAKASALSFVPEVDNHGPKLLVWSAADEESLNHLTGAFSEHFAQDGEHLLPADGYVKDLAYTLNQRRTLLQWRSFAVAETLEQLSDLKSLLSLPVPSSSDLRLGFVFTGQGAQWSGMGRALFAYPAFRKSVQDASDYLRSLGCDWSIEDALTGNVGRDFKIDNPKVAQPLCTVLQVALVDLLTSVGIVPSVVVGHSFGEIAAAYTSGALSRESAWKVAYFGGFFASRVAASSKQRGGMISVGLSEEDVEPYLAAITSEMGHGDMVVACVNSPSNVTISGCVKQLEALKSVLDAESIFARMLKVPVAYHGPHMHRISEEYLESISDLALGSAEMRKHVSMISSVTGLPAAALDLCTPEYWIQNLESPVRFLEAVQETCTWISTETCESSDEETQINMWATDLLEIGPNFTLSGPIRDILQSLPHGNSISYGSVLIRHQSAANTLLTAAGRLHSLGYHVDIPLLNMANEKPKAQPLVLPDLPGYTFNHNQIYWEVPRVSKEVGPKGQRINPYIGAPVDDWNPLDARWRHLLNPRDFDWIADHVIDGVILYPAAGMLVMVIEAAAELAGDAKVSAFEIRDATFHAALTIPVDSQGVETQLNMRLCSDTSSKGSSLSDFQLYAIQSDKWTEVCRGTIRTIYSNDWINEVDHANEETHMRRTAIRKFHNASNLCTNFTRGDKLYRRWRRWGYNFGPTMLRIQSARFAKDGEAIGDIKVLDTEGHDEPQVIHPATLAGIIQTMLLGLTSGSNDFTPSLPTRIDKIWISRTGLLSKDTAHLDSWVSVKKKGFRMIESTIMALSKECRSLRVAIQGIECTSLSDTVTDTSPLNQPAPVKKLCWDMVYKPDIQHLSKNELIEYVGSGPAIKSLSDEFYSDLKLLLLSYVAKTMSEISEGDIDSANEHLGKVWAWMQERFEHAAMSEDELLQLSLGPEVFDNIVERLRDQELPQTNFYMHMLEQCSQMLRGETDPLELMFQGSVLREFYDGLLETANYVAPLKRYLDLVAHKNPSVKILEVGAGSGSTTKLMLDIFTKETSSGRSAAYSEYTFTDASHSFFSAAEEEFAACPKMKYQVLDIDTDPIAQGFEEGQYDLIIAGNTLHTSTSVNVALRNVRRLLKAGGQLVMIDMTNPKSLRGGLAFGFLPGWWNSAEASRANSPCLTEEEWSEALTSSGFGGADFTFHDHENADYQFTSLIIATAADPSPAKEKAATPLTIVVIAPETHLSLTGLVTEQLGSIGISNLKVLSFEDASRVEGLEEDFLVIIDPSERPLLQNLEQKKFSSFHKTISRAKNALWITERAENAPLDPSQGAITGLARALRTEDSSVKFTTLLLDQRSPSKAAKISSAIKNTLQADFSSGYEPELMEENGLLLIPRLVEYDQLNHRVSEQTAELIPRNIPFGEGNLHLTIGTPGLLDSLYFRGTPESILPLGPNQIDVQVKAIGVNFTDCLVALDRATTDTLGSECAGIVTRVGEKCSLKPGDRVVINELDVYKGMVRCNESLAARIPDDMPFVEAAKLPNNFITAYHALVEIGRVQAGETVLIHAGAGGTGQAAIQVAQNFGAEVFVTVSSEKKKELVTKFYGIPEDHVLYSRDTSFALGLKRLTGGRGVDLILNSLAGDELRASWECIAPYGRFLEIGNRDIFSHGKLPMYQFAKNVSFTAIDINAMAKERPDLIQKSLQGVLKLAEKKAIHVASPLKIFSIHQVEEAFRYLRAGNSGSVVIDVEQDAVVPAFIPPTTTYSFNPEATYLISGGLGGQGRSIIRWMASRGAKHFLALSRHGAVSAEARALIAELKSSGVKIQAPLCDVSNRLSLVGVLRTAKETMPPIRGCIQAAMEIKDTVFESMNSEDWKVATKPKIQGSWNLHAQLPRDLDFFVMLSSASGIVGSKDQPNYAAGSTYQDALARFRHSRGEKAVALDLSVMDEEGYLANLQEAKEHVLRSKQLLPISQKELFAILDHFCDPELSVKESKSQIVTGLDLPTSVRQRGMDEARWMEFPLFSHLRELESTGVDGETGSPASAKTDINVALRNTTSLAEAGLLIANEVRGKLSKILSRSADEIDIGRSMQVYGVDSLVAVELRNWFLKSLKADVGIFEMLRGASIEALGFAVADKLKSWE